MRELLRRLRYWFQRDRFERELDEEMRHHLALKEPGSVPFGNITLLKENSRAMWTFTFWEQFAQDVRYGLRAMVANRLFTAMAVVSLALGIGANTAIYSFMDAVLLRALPVRNPQELVIVKWHSTGQPAVIHGSNGSRYRDGKHGTISPNFPYAAFEMLRANQTGVAPLFAYASAYEINLVADGQAEVAQGQYVSGGYYSGLGVKPAAGRLIIDDDDRAGATPVAVISYTYWQRRYALDPAVVGKRLLINNVPFTIIGVSAPGFFGVDSGKEPFVFMPLHVVPLLSPRPAEEEKRRFFDRSFYWVEMMGRLRPGVTLAQAQAPFAGEFKRYVEGTARLPKEWKDMPALWLDEGGSGIDSLRRRYSKPLLILMTMVCLILTIACANIANLLLARATARRREMAVRLSLGAGRMRVIRQLLTESLLLSLTGGVLGLLVAFWGIHSITWLLSSTRSVLRADLNWPVLGFTMALAVVTGIVFGLAPALQATKLDLTSTLKETRAGATQARTRRFGFRVGLSQALVVGQIAISLLLVVAAGLFVQTLANLRSVELGFNQDNVLLFNLNAKQAGYKDAALAGFYSGLLERFRAIPGVATAGLSENALVSGYWNENSLVLPGSPVAPGARQPSTAYMVVDPGFLPTMQIPVLVGRGIEPRDMASPRVAVVSEQFAKQFFPNQSPVGQRIGFGEPKDPADIEIVGVARNSRYNDLRNDNPPVAYVPYTQDLKGLGRVEFELRTTGNPLAIAGTVRQIVHKASASVPVSEVTTQRDAIDETISQERTFANLCTCFALLALLIACVGLYGTMAYSVARRTSEIGIRMALGAQRRWIVWMVLREVLLLAVVGLGIGLTVAWETAHFVGSFLFGMKPNDPVALAVAVVVMAAAAILAGYAPAWRAARIDPMAALRHE